MLGVADDQGRFMQCRVVGFHGGREISLAEIETNTVHGGVSSRLENVQWFHGLYADWK